MKKIVLFIFLLAAQFSHASLQIEEMKMELSSHHGFIREIVTDLVEHIMDDESPVTINMSTYRQLLKKEMEGRKHFENASFLHRMNRFYEGDLRQCEYELKRKDFVIAKAINDLIHCEKRETRAVVETEEVRLILFNIIDKKRAADVQEAIEIFKSYASAYDTKDKILLAKQNKEKYFYNSYDQMMDERQAR